MTRREVLKVGVAAMVAAPSTPVPVKPSPRRAQVDWNDWVPDQALIFIWIPPRRVAFAEHCIRIKRMYKPNEGDDVIVLFEGQQRHGVIIWTNAATRIAGVEFDVDGAPATHGYAWGVIKPAGDGDLSPA